MNSERFFVVQKVWELVKLCAERRLASSLFAKGTAIAPGAASFRGALRLLFPPPGQWALPATCHKLALTGTIEGIVLGKRTAKLGPLVCRNDSACLRKGGRPANRFRGRFRGSGAPVKA
jgi:hypothetical protein